MCGPHPFDISTLRPKLVLPTEFEPIRGWRIAFSRDLGFFEVDLEVERNTLAALDVLRSLGATVEDVDLGWSESTLGPAIAYLGHLFGGYISKLLDEHADKMTSYARAFAESSLDSSELAPQQDVRDARAPAPDNRDLRITGRELARGRQQDVRDARAPA